MSNAVGYALLTAASVAAAKAGMPHILAPYVAMLQHTISLLPR